MQITYDNYPVLECLKTKELKFHIFHEDYENINNMTDDLRKYFKLSVDDFNKNINIITQPFREACFYNVEKFMEILNNIFFDKAIDFNICGTFIEKKVITFLKLDIKKDIDLFDIVFLRFEDNVLIDVQIGDVKNDFNLLFRTVLDGVVNIDNALRYSHLYVIYELFKRYADVETIELNSNKKVKTINCKYKNNTDIDFTILDSTWFTNLIKSDGFKVRGHFRLQPYKKNGEWTKKLKWIKEFEKKGYTRKAKINNY